MKRILLDVNVILDILLDRPPFAATASALWAAAERKEVEAFVPAHGVTTVFYLAARQRGAAFARRVVNELLLVPRIAAVDVRVLRRAFALGWGDFEDSVCAAAAEATACEILVTRDPKGYPLCPVLVADPQTALSLLGVGSHPGGVADRLTAAHGLRGTARSPRASGRRRRRRIDRPEA